MRRWRSLNRAYAWVMGYFWIRCPLCYQWFGGHECGEVSVSLGLDGSQRICCWRHEYADPFIRPTGIKTS